MIITVKPDIVFVFRDGSYHRFHCTICGYVSDTTQCLGIKSAEAWAAAHQASHTLQYTS